MKTLKISGLFLGLMAFSSVSAVSREPASELDSLTVSGSLIQTSEFSNTGAVATVSGEELAESPTPNLTNRLAGRLPGLFVLKGDGTPGEGTAKMYIRGIGSYAKGTETNTMKYYVDGFEVKSDYIEFLNPEEIKSVSVLKDAAALATFGMNGANGVIWIETNRGQISAPVVSFQLRTGVQSPINVAKPLDSYGYASLYNQAVSNDNGRVWTPYYSDSQLEAYRTGQGVDVDWYDEVFKRNSMYTDAVLSFRGGSEMVRYNVVLDYANQQGLLNVRNTDATSNATYIKYGLRTNLDLKLNKILTVSVDIGGRLEDRSRPDYDVATLVQDVLKYPSNIYPVYDEASTDPISNFSGTAIYPNNPVGSLKGLGWTTSRTKLLQANFKFREDLDILLKGLYLEEGFSFYTKTIGNTSKTRTYARYFNGTAQTSDVSTYIRSNSYWSSGKELWMQGNLTLGYSNKFGDHAINAALNAHVSDYSGNADYFYDWKFRYANFNGRINYTYDDRYVAELGFSYFGTDAYSAGHRFFFYPAGSLGWVVSNESFLESSNVIKYLKIRASAGLTGATEADLSLADFDTDGRYLYEQYYGSGGSFLTGVGPSYGSGNALIPLFTANPDVTAEKSLKYNVGFDLNIAGRLSVTADYFRDNRSGILTLDNSIMDYYGKNYYYSNVGRMTNQGLDASIIYSDKSGDFNWSVFGNAVYAVNKVDYMAEVPTKYPYNASTGLPYGTRMGLECIGFYDTDDFNPLTGELKSGIPVPLYGDVQPGDLRYADKDGDNYVDDTDITNIGNPAYPKFMYSFGADFAFRGFDLSLLFTGSAGATVNLLDYDTWKPFNNNGNVFRWAENAWAYYPSQNIDTRETATFPRLTTQQNDNNYRASSFWIRKNNWLRLQNVELGYDFATLRAVRDAGITKCRLYVNAYNLLTFSELLADYDMDPETANYGYPALKSVNVGVQISF